MTDDLSRIEPWIGELVRKLSPRERRKVALKLGQALRRENARRIAANVDPDGAAMEPRARRVDAREGRVRRKMFPQIAKIRSLKVKPSPDGVEVGFVNPLVASTAAVHHFGEVGYVGRTRGGRTIRTRYPERRLLGFSEADMAIVTDALLAHIE